MENGQCKFVTGTRDGKKFRCRIKRIVCIISHQGKCYIYEHRPKSKKILVVFISNSSLADYMKVIKDPHFFPIFRGKVFNTRFYEGHTLLRKLFTTIEEVPELCIARDRFSDFEEHIKYW